MKIIAIAHKPQGYFRIVALLTTIPVRETSEAVTIYIYPDTGNDDQSDSKKHLQFGAMLDSWRMNPWRKTQINIIWRANPGLVGGFNHLEKYEFVNGKDYPIYDEKKCLKPPARGLSVFFS